MDEVEFDMDEIMILYQACQAPFVTDTAAVAIEFVKMLNHQITPDAWVAYMTGLFPDHVADAQELANACMGAPA